MPEITNLPMTTSGYFSNQELLEIVEAMGDSHPISKLALYIHTERLIPEPPIVSFASQMLRRATDEARCLDLLERLKIEGAIGMMGELDLGKLRSWVQRSR